MPILEVTDSALVQVCAKCGETNTVALNDLTVGAVNGDRVMPNVLRLPACECGAVEQLNQTFDPAPPEVRTSAFGKRRALVNALCQKLIADGRGHSDCRLLHRAAPPDMADFNKPAERTALIPEDVWQKKKKRDAARKE